MGGRLPLDGVRVLEFGTGYVGPVLAMRLGDFGADVIKVESRRGLDFMRATGPDPDGSPSFFDANRSKRSCTVDASQPAGRELVYRLVRLADLVIENLGGGVMKRLGLDYATLREIKPDLLMISLQGLGGKAPRSVTLGQNLPPLIGMTYLWNHPGAPHPVGSQLFHPDYFAGVAGSCLAMAMLDHRRRTGQGHYVDAAQAELAASLLGPFYLDWTVNRRVSEPQGNRAYPGAPVGCYRCASYGSSADEPARPSGGAGEDAWCAIAVSTDEQWEGFCRALGDPAWTREPRFATLADRLRHRDELDRLVEAWTREREPHVVMDTLQAEGVPAGAALTGEDLLTDPQLRAREFIATLEHGKLGRIQQGGIPPRLSDTPGAIRRPAPMLGQHTAEVLREWLALPDDEIARLDAEGVLH